MNFGFSIKFMFQMHPLEDLIITICGVESKSSDWVRIRHLLTYHTWTGVSTFSCTNALVLKCCVRSNHVFRYRIFSNEIHFLQTRQKFVRQIAVGYNANRSKAIHYTFTVINTRRSASFSVEADWLQLAC